MEQKLQDIDFTSTPYNASPLVRKKSCKSGDKERTSENVSVPDTETVDEGELVHPPGHEKTSSSNKSVNPHVDLQFADQSTKFSCKVYFADSFFKLRKLLYSEGEESYIRSLSHCMYWSAQGGKSGSTFCKTQDDRFIMKEMSRYEIQSFLEFAPNYFQYITQAFVEQKPTALAKIVGVYKIGPRGSQNKQDVLVIENLFHGRQISRKFDLKGSLRNRMANTAVQQEGDLVLLDENLLKMACENPLYVHPHAKTVLSQAIFNDTNFLSNQTVMDYSLLVGVDSDQQELVVGIIDYVRTFTWDKKAEMLVKSMDRILGGHGKLPTVVSPELYRTRFCEAMNQYFLPVPDRWYGLGKDVPVNIPTI